MAFWDYLHHSYGWQAPLSQATRGHGHETAEVSSAKIAVNTSFISGASAALTYGPGPLIEHEDMYNKPYKIRFPTSIEVGFGKWLHGPHYTYEDPKLWVSRAFVGTRISTAKHTTCCCQLMEGNLESGYFHLTEHCRAVVPFDALDPWYLGLTRTQINDRIAEDCAPWNPENAQSYPATAAVCPASNETAMAWYALQPHFWAVPPWIEVYEPVADNKSSYMQELLQSDGEENAVPKENTGTPAIFIVCFCCVLAAFAFSSIRKAGNLRLRRRIQDDCDPYSALIDC